MAPPSPDLPMLHHQSVVTEKPLHLPAGLDQAQAPHLDKEGWFLMEMLALIQGQGSFLWLLGVRN
jgi:hypothetical protein